MIITLQQLKRALGGDISAGQVRAPGPNHKPKDRSLSVKIDAAHPDGFIVHSFAGDDPTLCKDFVREKLGLDAFKPKSANGSTSKKPETTKSRIEKTVYDYHDENGAVMFQVVRFDPKGFSQRRPDGKGGHIWNLDGVRRIPYRLPELIEAIACEKPVFIAEGEKDVDALIGIGVIATCNPGGAGNWCDEYSVHLKDADVVIIPDKDAAGEKHLAQVSSSLAGIAAKVRVLRLPTKDAHDWIAAGGTADQLWGLVAGSEGAERSALIQLSRDFVAGFVPPDYLIEGLLQRRYFYSFTARTGDGKTAVALTLAAHVALGQQVGGRDVEKGKVLYFAGENPTDVKMRWIAMAERMGFDANTIEVYFIEGAFHFKEVADRIQQEVAALGIEFSLIVIDTSAAYFDGEQENDNAQHGDYARRLRSLTKIPGGPTVLVLCHPVKNAASDNLIPRGGGAYLAEVDGNLTCLLNGKVVEVHWQGKFRGLNFEPMHFELIEVTAERLKDQKGEKIVTVMARPLDDREHSKRIAETRNEEETLLVAMLDNQEASVADLGRKCGWLISRGKDIGKPQKSKVSGKLSALKTAAMVRNTLGTWELTDKGTKLAEKMKAKNRSEAA